MNIHLISGERNTLLQPSFRDLFGNITVILLCIILYRLKTVEQVYTIEVLSYTNIVLSFLMVNKKIVFN